MVISLNIRRRLIAGCRDSRKQNSIFSRSRPNEWNPTSLRHPVSGDTFTPAGAWYFIKELLEGEIDVDTINLDKPPGAIGYVIKTPGFGTETIYIKLELKGDQIYGRSFHVSER